VQAPNSILNTLFILNQRRSNGLSDVIPLQFKFGTPPAMIEELKARMLDFCLEHKRDYQPTIITEMTGVDQIRSANMNMVFIHKSNFQNELLRLNRHNKFVTELLFQLEKIGIQGPLRVDPGGSREYPMYYAGSQPPPYNNGKEQQQDGHAGHVPGPAPSRGAMPRHNSVRSTHLPTTNEEAIVGFQDVFENRRDQSLARRMESIREKDIAEQREIEKEPRASTTSTALTPTQSVNSQHRSRFFGRHRSGTKSQQQQPQQSDIV
jgi:small-conductance mechanosensitive channel